MGALTPDEQSEYREWIRAGFARIAPLDRTRELAEKGRRDDPDLWADLSDLGVLGSAIPEDFGGSDIGGPGLAIALMEAARLLIPAPYLSTAFIVPLMIRRAGGELLHADLLREIAEGRTRCAVAVAPARSGPLPAAHRLGDSWVLTGTLPIVLEGDVADRLLVTAETDSGTALFVTVSGEGVAVEPLDSLDVTRPVAAMTLDSVPALPLSDAADAAPLIADLDDVIRMTLAADAVGGAQQLLDMSVEYAKLRTQFGQPIGQFQAIKHRCADLFVAIQAATAAVEAAFDELEKLSWPRPVTVAVGSVHAQQTFSEAARAAMQIHGGLALTWELDTHLYLKRAVASQHLLGNPDREIVRLADAVLADGYDVVQELIG